jgi:hypothetical protein
MPEVGGPLTNTDTEAKDTLSGLPVGYELRVNTYEFPGERLLGVMLRVYVTFLAS